MLVFVDVDSEWIVSEYPSQVPISFQVAIVTVGYQVVSSSRQMYDHVSQRIDVL